MRRALLLTFGWCLLACDGGDIAVFAAQAGSSGNGGTAGASGGGADTRGGADSGGGAGEGGLSGFAGFAGGGASGGQSGDLGTSNGGQGGSSDTPCHGNMECPSTFYCSKSACSEPQGTCLPRPFPDAGLESPVCGCDHVTYWNDTLRQRYGVASSMPGQCMSNARHCDNDKDCGSPDASCPHLLPPDTSCGPQPGPGTCWVTPIDCSPGDNADYQVCPPPGGSGGASSCVTKCQAVKSGHPFMQVSTASCP